MERGPHGERCPHPETLLTYLPRSPVTDSPRVPLHGAHSVFSRTRSVPQNKTRITQFFTSNRPKTSAFHHKLHGNVQERFIGRGDRGRVARRLGCCATGGDRGRVAQWLRCCVTGGDRGRVAQRLRCCATGGDRGRVAQWLRCCATGGDRGSTVVKVLCYWWGPR